MIVKDVMISISGKPVNQGIVEAASNILSGKSSSVKLASIPCTQCGKDVAWKFVDDGGQETHLIFVPSVRMVFGVQPLIRDKVGEKQWGLSGESVYICNSCLSKEGKIPEIIAEQVPELRDKLQNKPIVDMPRFEEDLGCWITVTELELDGQGRFCNFQTDIKKFIEIRDFLHNHYRFISATT